MTKAELLELIRMLPDDAELGVTAQKADLVRALEDGGANPDRIVDTSYCAEHLGMSRTWWAKECRDEKIAEAFQEEEGRRWYLPLGAARDHLRAYRDSRTPSRRRRRGPWKTEAA